jgi:hypothetical protein
MGVFVGTSTQDDPPDAVCGTFDDLYNEEDRQKCVRLSRKWASKTIGNCT